MVTDWKLGKPLPQRRGQPQISLRFRGGDEDESSEQPYDQTDPRVALHNSGFATPIGPNPYTSIPMGAIKGPELRNNSVTSPKIESITSKTITGGIIRSAESGGRVQIDESDNDRITFYANDELEAAHLSADATTKDFVLQGRADLFIQTDDTLEVTSGDTLRILNTGAVGAGQDVVLMAAGKVHLEQTPLRIGGAVSLDNFIELDNTGGNVADPVAGRCRIHYDSSGATPQLEARANGVGRVLATF